MSKSELVRRLAGRFQHLVKQDAEIAVNLIVCAMTEALAHGRRIELREFGSFTLRMRKARKARNPRTGESVNVPAKPRIYFRPTGDLKRRVGAVAAIQAHDKGRLISASNESHVKASGDSQIGPRDLADLLKTTD
jgi:integration host factor subunit beta